MFEIDPARILIALLAFIRIGAILFALPFFGDDTTPVRVRVLMAVALTFCFYSLLLPVWNVGDLRFTQDVLLFGSFILKELFIGLAIGFIARMMFDGIIMASNIVGYQMGFGTASLFMPGSLDHHNGFTAFNKALIVLIFLAFNFHHFFIQTIFETFRTIPLGGAYPRSGYVQHIILLSADMFVSAMQLAAPIVIAILFATVALGLIARTVPQANIFVMSFPVGFYVGLFVFFATMPFLGGWLQEYFGKMNQALALTIRTLAP